MRLFSNFLPALKRIAESFLGWWLFYSLSMIALPSFLITAEYQSYSFGGRLLFFLMAANSKIWFLMSRFSGQEAFFVASGVGY